MLTPEQELILSEILGKPKEFIIARPDIRLSRNQKLAFDKMNKALERGMPLAYVLGYKWFHGNKFAVNKNVLIPRPETEQLVDLALDLVKKHSLKTIVDIGTGPGTIIVSLTKELKKHKTNVKPEFFASDISSAALTMAKKNATTILNKHEIKFTKGNLLTPLSKELKGRSNVLITANLPYLSKEELNEPSIKHEPKLALLGGKNSHDRIEELLKQIAALRLKNAWVILETNWDQKKVLQQVVKKRLPKADAKFYKDIGKRDRFIVITLR